MASKKAYQENPCTLRAFAGFSTLYGAIKFEDALQAAGKHGVLWLILQS